MTLGELLSEVMTLQADYTPDPNSPLMIRRKELVEREIPERLGPLVASTFPTWEAGGSNGKGNPAEVPWSRYFDPAASPAPTDGWYAVYLFDAVGEAVYLSLNQGTTAWNVDKQDFVFKPKTQLIPRVQWAREVLAASNNGTKSFDEIDLRGRQRLGKVYQFGNVHGIRYQLQAMPSDDELRNDLIQIGRMLEQLYKADALTAYIPGDEPPEILDAELASANAAGNTRRRGKGQGFRLNHAEQVAIEQHAVKLAIEYFKKLGYRIKNTGSTESYDLLATRGEEKVYVEVKGTTSPGEQIILTRKEVEHHTEHSDNALVVVHSILLDRAQQPPVAYGGTRVVTQPWKIDESNLTVISYRYKIPIDAMDP